jgi:hypothetical protein
VDEGPCLHGAAPQLARIRLPILKERFREQEAEGTRMPEGMPLDELALRI